MSLGTLGFVKAGKVIFGEQRFVRAGVFGVSFGWVWYVSAGEVS